MTRSSSRFGSTALVVLAALALTLAACGGSGTPATAGPVGTVAPASGGTTGGPITGKRVCEIVTLEMATQILGEAPPRGEASDDRLAKSHTCAYKPGPKLILQVQVIEGFDTVEKFETSMARFSVKTPVEGIGEKAYFVARTEPPPGTRLYVLAKGYTVLVNIGSDKVTEEEMQGTARTLAPTVIDAL